MRSIFTLGGGRIPLLFAVRPKRPTGFLNVDLEIVSSNSLDCLAEGMSKAITVLHSGPIGRRHLLCLESSRWRNTPDAAARDLCGAVEQLSPAARSFWERARRKEFNVGYELQTGLRAVQVTQQPDTVRRIVALGATVAFTCYRGDGSEPEPAGLPRYESNLSAGWLRSLTCALANEEKPWRD